VTFAVDLIFSAPARDMLSLDPGTGASRPPFCALRYADGAARDGTSRHLPPHLANCSCAWPVATSSGASDDGILVDENVIATALEEDMDAVAEEEAEEDDVEVADDEWAAVREARDRAELSCAWCWCAGMRPCFSRGALPSGGLFARDIGPLIDSVV